MDTQTIEIIGRNRLVEQLLEAGLEVASPLRDRGIDLIAYADRAEDVGRFVACPIQMKAATARSFSMDGKYAKFPNLIIAFVWGVGTLGETEIFALTHQQLRAIAEKFNWTLPSTEKRSVSNPGVKLIAELEQYRMTPVKWWELVTSLQAAAQ